MEQACYRNIRQRGVVEVIPLIIITILAAATFLVVNQVENGRQEIRQRASSSTSCFGSTRSDCENVVGCHFTDATYASCAGTDCTRSGCTRVPGQCNNYTPACPPGCTTGYSTCSFVNGTCPSSCTYTPGTAAHCTGSIPTYCTVNTTQSSCTSSPYGCQWVGATSATCIGNYPTSCSGTTDIVSTCTGNYQVSSSSCNGTPIRPTPTPSPNYKRCRGNACTVTTDPSGVACADNVDCALPSVAFSANPTTVAYNAGSTLSWTATNATSCTASGAWTGTKATSGTFATGNLTASKTYTLTCTNSIGSVNRSVTVTVSTNCTFSCGDGICCTTAGEDTGTCYSDCRSSPLPSINPNTCTTSGGTCWNAPGGCVSIGRSSVSGSCSGGQVCCGNSTIRPSPTPTPASCTFSCGDGKCCTTAGEDAGTCYSDCRSTASPGPSTNPNACTSPGTFRCLNGDSQVCGANYLYSTIDVCGTRPCVGGNCESAPTITFSANPTSIAYNTGSTLSWNVYYATSCTGSGFSVGSSMLGSVSTGNLIITMSYSLSCTGAGGTTSRSVTVSVATPPCQSVNQSCSGTGTGNCCQAGTQTLNCVSLPSGKFCQASVCTNGTKRCSNSYIQECQNGSWLNTSNCGAGCNSSGFTPVCNTACTANATRCATSNALETCAADGSAWVQRSCTYGCQTVGSISSCKTSSSTVAGIIGSACTTNSDCSSNYCSNRVCTIPTTNSTSLIGGTPVFGGTLSLGTNTSPYAQGSGLYAQSCTGPFGSCPEDLGIISLGTGLAGGLGGAAYAGATPAYVYGSLTLGAAGSYFSQTPAGQAVLNTLANPYVQQGAAWVPLVTTVTTDIACSQGAINPETCASIEQGQRDFVGALAAQNLSTNALSPQEVQSIANEIKSFDRQAFLATQTYVAPLNPRQGALIINPAEDLVLQNYLDDVGQFIRNYNEEDPTDVVHPAVLAQRYIEKSFPNFNSGSGVATVATQEQVRQASYNLYAQGGGAASLGQFIEGGCAVCREQSVLLSTALTNEGISNNLMTGTFSIGRHAWVEYFDATTGEQMVADSVWGFVLPMDEAYKVYGGITAIRQQVIVNP